MTTEQKTMADQLRPTNFDGYIGQERLKEILRVSICAALLAHPQHPMEHTLLAGPPGAGKTTLARLIADSLAENFMVAEMPLNDADYRDLRGFAGVLFLDEIHRGNKAQQEELFPLLEHGYMRPKSRFRLEFDWLTVIGATTEPAKLVRPLRDRFVLVPHFDPYADSELATIVAAMGHKVGIEFTLTDCELLGRACAGIPRTAGALVQTAQNLAIITGTQPIVSEVLRLRQLDANGLGPDHQEYLELLWKIGGPIGLAPLKNILDKDEASIRDLERVLIRQGLILPTFRGRELTAKGYLRMKPNRKETQNGNQSSSV